MTNDGLAERRAMAAEGDLPGLLSKLVERSRPVLERMPPIPREKATLSSDGGACPTCRSQLEFDPWSPDRHKCSGCGAVAEGDRHRTHWARAQHLWLAERAAHLATVAAFADDEAAAERSREILAAYFELYHELPNRDNVLGPSHLFFSTYLESIWILDYLAAAFLLREIGRLSQEDIEAINGIADEAARLIGEFDEGMSNRQTWNSAALVAIAVWFDDEELAQSAIGGRSGLLGHLTDGFGDDGMWIEGENYHLFAIRGLLIGLDWARLAGADLLDDPHLATVLGRALLAPAATALPDFSFPARKDARFGVSLAHPAYLECWEYGVARLGEDAPPELVSWLTALYQVPAAVAQTYDAYLHDAAEVVRPRTERTDLSWWMMLAMAPELPASEAPWTGESRLLETQGVAVLRQPNRYVALECGAFGGGHGHPDRLNLTVHADGVHWLADPGAGSYVTRDLFWFRSTLAHNAPRLGGVSQPAEAASCRAFDDQGEWGWIVARFEEIERTVVRGPSWILDIVDSTGSQPTVLELPWHLDGSVTVETPGEWSSAELKDEFATAAEQFTAKEGADPILRAVVGERAVRLHLVGGTLLRATAPGRPGQPARPFHFVRAAGARVRLVALLELGEPVQSVNAGSDRVEIVADGGTTSIRLGRASATISGPGGEVSLGGDRPTRPPHKPMLTERPIRAEGAALRVVERPALDGSLDGFDTGAPMEMADESHYFRSEEGYESPDTFSATAFVNWDFEHVYLAVEVMKPEVLVRGADAAPLLLDNEPDDINSDGIQVYYRLGSGPARSFLIRPTHAGAVLARAIGTESGDAASVAGRSVIGDDGYRITVELPCPELTGVLDGAQLAFDVCVNEMRSERIRRAGQLAWGGGGGWIYLRGDRRDEARWGRLELTG